MKRLSLFYRNLIGHARVSGLRTALLLAWYGVPAIAGGAADTSTTFAADFTTYIADKTLMVAQKMLRMQQLADKATLPRRNSKTFQYTRYERINLPQNTLTEGVTPAESNMSISTVQAIVEQWGQVVILTDVAELVVKHPVVQKGIDLLALAAAETVDREIQEVLLAGTNVQYANAKATRANLLNTDVMTTVEVTKATANLRTNGAMPYEGDDLFGVLDPSVEADVSVDTTWVTAMSYSSIANLRNFESGKWKGVRWMRSNFLHKFTGFANTAFTLADVTTGGSLLANTTYYVVVTGVNNATGFEEYGFQEKTQATANDGNNTHKVRVTAPSTAGYTYNIYVGTASGTTYLVTTGVAPSGTYDIAAAPGAGTTNPPLAATGVTVHVSWVMGKEAFTSVELDGMSLQTYVTPRGPSDSDPLAQRRKIGWKLMFKAVINNQNFMRRIESGSAY